MMAWVRTGVDLACLALGLAVSNWLLGGEFTTAHYALAVGAYTLLQHNKEYNA